MDQRAVGAVVGVAWGKHSTQKIEGVRRSGVSVQTPTRTHTHWSGVGLVSRRFSPFLTRSVFLVFLVNSNRIFVAVYEDGVHQ